MQYRGQKYDAVSEVTIGIFVPPGAIDPDTVEGQDKIEAVSGIFEAAAAAALNKCRDEHPDLDVQIEVNGEREPI